ncbi:unnamed protein product [Rotaria magnacalcarata]
MNGQGKEVSIEFRVTQKSTKQCDLPSSTNQQKKENNTRRNRIAFVRRKLLTYELRLLTKFKLIIWMFSFCKNIIQVGVILDEIDSINGHWDNQHVNPSPDSSLDKKIEILFDTMRKENEKK